MGQSAQYLDPERRIDRRQQLMEAGMTVFLDHVQTPAGVTRQIRKATAHILAVYRDNATLALICLL